MSDTTTFIPGDQFVAGDQTTSTPAHTQILPNGKPARPDFAARLTADQEALAALTREREGKERRIARNIKTIADLETENAGLTLDVRDDRLYEKTYALSIESHRKSIATLAKLTDRS